jgi:hypothetical protein
MMVFHLNNAALVAILFNLWGIRVSLSLTLPSDYEKLARKHAPVIVFHPDEQFFPSSVE